MKLVTQFLLFLVNAFRAVILLLILLVIFGLVSPFIENLNSFSYFRPVISFENNINQKVKAAVPTKIAGKDASRIMTLIALILIFELAKNLQNSLEFSLQKRNLENQKIRFQKTYKSSMEKERLAKLESKMEEVQQAKGRSRYDLLKEFVDLKKELEKIGRDLAFLSIDVVDSTAMKLNEDSAVVEHDFHEYHNYIEAKFKLHGFVRASWTPDGVMACFNNIEDAVMAAQDIVNGLDYFNNNVKVMKTPFMVRCGINAGFVYYDESIPLEQLSDRTIDIAGHMQKHASPNAILIAKQIIEPVQFHEYFVPTQRVVDGLEVCEWDHAKSPAKERS